MDPKSNTEYDPTKVLFIRGLGPNVTERDIIDLCSEVGVILQVFLLRHKGQSFIEFDSQEAAEFCLLHYSRNPVTLYGNNLHFSFSGREQVTKKT